MCIQYKLLATMAAITKISLQLEAVCGFVEKLGQIIEVDEDINAVIEKYMAELRQKPDADTELFTEAPVRKEKKARKAKVNADGTPKKKRDPSPYNMFVSEKWGMLTEQGFKGPELIRQAALLWNALPENQGKEKKEKKPKQPPVTEAADEE